MRYFNSSPEVVHLTVMHCIYLGLSPPQIEDLVFERGIKMCYGASRGAPCGSAGTALDSDSPRR